jgi:hypothetical protein
MPKAIPILSQFHNLSAGDLADEHGQLCAQIADLENRKRAVAGGLIRRGVTEEANELTLAECDEITLINNAA